MAEAVARYPYEAPVTAYGNGGFRFAEMSHRGSILCLPTGIYAWHVTSPEGLTAADFEPYLSQLEPPMALLLGTGATQVWPSAELTAAFVRAGIGLEPMSTGAAARTYNILVGEKRRVAAALIAVP